MKLYRKGLQPKLDVIRLLQGCDTQHVVKIFDAGEADGVWYEVLEYADGTLRDLLGMGPADSDRTKRILLELTQALKHIHSHNLIHRDLKPENILVREKDPLDLILTDFGIASLSGETQHFTSTNRTVKYGAPETCGGAVSAKSDYWSLGLIVLESLMGKHPFDGLSDMVVVKQLISSQIDLREVKDPRWVLLLKGLLTRNPEKRWAGKEVDEWFKGKTPSIAFEEFDRPSQRPYKIAHTECWTAPELAIALASHWKEGVKDIGRGLIVPWLRDELRDQEACRVLMDLMDDRKLTHDERLLRFIAHIGRGLPSNWKGLSLQLSSIMNLCRDNLSDNPSHPGVIEELYEKEVFDVWSSAGNEESRSIGDQWKAAVQEFETEWSLLAATKELSQPPPNKKLLLPALLLVIVSPDFRSTLAHDLAGAPTAINASDLYVRLCERHSLALLLLRHTISTEAVSIGLKEQGAAVDINKFSDSLAQDFGTVLAQDPDYHQTLVTLKNAVINRQARLLVGQEHEIREKLFERAKSRLVSQEFRTRTVVGFGEILLDGAIVGGMFCVYRALLGYWQLGEPGSYLMPSFSHMKNELEGEWVLLLGLLGLTSLAYLASKQLASAYFKQSGATGKSPSDRNNG